MQTTKINGTLTEGNQRNLTLRIWLSDKQREAFVLEKGVCPSQMKIVIMNGGEDRIEDYLDKTKGIIE